MAAVVKYVHSGAQASHNIQALVGSVFITLLILFWRSHHPDFLYLSSPSVALDSAAGTSGPSSVQTAYSWATDGGAHQATSSSSSCPLSAHCVLLKLGIIRRNQGFILVIRGMTLEGRIVLTGV